MLNSMVFVTALGPGSLFGLATFSHKIGLYDVQGPIPVVKNIFIHPDSDKIMSIELEDVMPLFSFLAPVCFLTDFCHIEYVLFPWFLVRLSARCPSPLVRVSNKVL